MFTRLGVEQDSRRLQSLGTEDHSSTGNVVSLSRVAVDISHALSPVGLGIHLHMTDNGVGQECAVTGLEGIGHGGEWTTEIREGDTTPLTRTTVMTGCPAIMVSRQNGRSANRHRTKEVFFSPVPAEQLFPTGHGHGRQKLTIRQDRMSLGCSADSHAAFHLVIEGFQIRVGDRPVLPIAIVAGRFEIQVTQAITLSTPDQTPPTQNAKTLPGRIMTALQ